MAVSEIEQATAVLRRGGVVAHATEGVWGLACDPRSDISVKKILDIKQREKEKGLILIGGLFSENQVLWHEWFHNVQL